MAIKPEKMFYQNGSYSFPSMFSDPCSLTYSSIERLIQKTKKEDYAKDGGSVVLSNMDSFYSDHLRI